MYQDQPGDFFLDIDSGHKLKKYGVDLSSYQRIYNFDSAVSNGHIYRRVAEYTSRRLRAASGGQAKASWAIPAPRVIQASS